MLDNPADLAALLAKISVAGKAGFSLLRPHITRQAERG